MYKVASSLKSGEKRDAEEPAAADADRNVMKEIRKSSGYEDTEGEQDFAVRGPNRVQFHAPRQPLKDKPVKGPARMNPRFQHV
jgi:hypothetical protein